VKSQADFSNAVQLGAPHLLRYVAAAIVMNKTRVNVLRDIVATIDQVVFFFGFCGMFFDSMWCFRQECYTYSDPLTEFLRSLVVDLDFDTALNNLNASADVLDLDFFLNAFKTEFTEAAKSLYFETFCRVHRCIDIR